MGNVTILPHDVQRLPAPLRTSLLEARKGLESINPKTLAVMLEETLALWPLPPNFGVTAKFYREALEDVPADLVAKALKQIRLSSKFFPKPAEIRELIRDELTRRRRERWEIEQKARNWKPSAPPVTEQDRAKVLQIFQQARQAVKTLERHEDD